MTTPVLACRDLVELVTDYLEGIMPAPERTLFEEHLAMCEGCAAYLDQMRRTIEATGRLAEEDIPQPVAEKLLRAFRDWRTG
jgi:anti-sigma factor RsiW